MQLRREGFVVAAMQHSLAVTCPFMCFGADQPRHGVEVTTSARVFLAAGSFVAGTVCVLWATAKLKRTSVQQMIGSMRMQSDAS
jgi:hypothetical protein